MEKTCQQMAAKWGISQRLVQLYCAQGEIPQARRVGRMWLIPADTPKPAHARHTGAGASVLFWPQLVLLDGSLMRLGSVERVLRQPMEEARRQQLAGQAAYLQGDYETARACLSGVRPDDHAYLCALTSAAIASAAMGDTHGVLFAQSVLAQLEEDYCDHLETRKMINLAQGLLSASAFAPMQVKPWLLGGVLKNLPEAARPAAMMIRAKSLLTFGRVAQAISVAEVALSLFQDSGGVVAGYLHLVMAQARIHTHQPQKARQAVLHALDIFMPMGFLSPLAEYITPMMGVVEQCMQTAFPQQLPQVLSLHQRVANGWRSVHNCMTGEQLTTLLTRREYQAAIGIAAGMSNQQCAQQMDVSLGTLKSHLEAVYRKLNITSRKELRSKILPEETLLKGEPHP